jgi:protein SCO1/2
LEFPKEQLMKIRVTLSIVALAVSVIVTACRNQSADKPRPTGEKVYDVRAKVIALDPTKPAVTLDHEDIPGLMKAMEMEFRVEDPKLLEGIKVGDQVHGRLKSSDGEYVLTSLEKATSPSGTGRQ